MGLWWPPSTFRTKYTKCSTFRNRNSTKMAPMADDAPPALVRVSNTSPQSVRGAIAVLANRWVQRSTAGRRSLHAARVSGELPKYVRLDEVLAAERRCASLRRPGLSGLLIRFLWVTGARVSEALGASWSDVDWTAHAVRLETLKRRARTMRAVTLPAAFVGQLAEARARGGSEPRIFPLSRSRAFEIVRDALVAVGVERPRAHPHALRHGHAVHALTNGVPLPAVQRTLGHSSIYTTGLYLQLTAQDVRGFYDQINW